MKLHGEMASEFGEQFCFDGDTPAMLFSAMISQVKGFRKYLSEKMFAIHLDDENIDEKQLVIKKEFSVMHVAPVIQGSGGKLGGVLMVVAGAVIVGAAVFFGQFWAIGIGVSIAVGGIAQLIAPTPKGAQQQQQQDQRQSFTFDGAENITQTGIPHPLIYGRMRVGSIVVSQQLEVNNVAVVNSSPATATFRA